MLGLRFAARPGVGCWVTVAALTCLANRAAAADAGLSSRRPAASAESSVKVLQLRKLARKMLHWGSATQDEEPIRLGPACARLFWQKEWKWPEHTAEQRLVAGLLGGPMLSIGIPLRVLGRLFSIETRLSSYRYAYADLDSGRTVLQELADPHDQYQSMEGGLYLTLPLAGIF